MKITLILIGLLLVAGCDNFASNSVLHIKNGQLLFDNIAKECKGELTISVNLSGNSELIITCTQTGPIDGSLLNIHKGEGK